MSIFAYHYRVRLGFTALELVIVMSIAAVIVAASVPAVLSAMRRNAVQRSAEAIISVSEEARRLSRSPRVEDASAIIPTPSTAIASSYGVGIFTDAQGAYVALLLAPPTGVVSASSICTRGGTVSPSTPLLKKYLNANCLPYNGKDAAASATAGKRIYGFISGATNVSWFFETGTGRLVSIAATSPREIGTKDTVGLNLVTSSSSASSPSGSLTPPTPSPEFFGVALLDSSYAIGIAIFNLGLNYSHEIAKDVPWPSP